MSDPLHSRLYLACEQLDIAIDLFFSEKSNVSSLTLAGAAEEIFGTEIKNRKLKNTMTVKYQVLCSLMRKANRQPPDWQAYNKLENYAKNAAKHIADKSKKDQQYDPYLRADLRQAAMHMLMRAANNVRLLGLPRSEAVQTLEGWYLANITFPFEPGA
jgi:hypothetical protein